MALLRILSLRYFAGNNAGNSAPSTERGYCQKSEGRCHFYCGFFLRPGAWKKTRPVPGLAACCPNIRVQVKVVSGGSAG